MANQQPTIAELQALIIMLQEQVVALQNVAPAAQAAPAAATTTVVFAETPQTLDVDDLINYSTKRGKDIYNQGCEALNNKALTNDFNLKPNETVVFIEALERKSDCVCHARALARASRLTY
jgi:hypothetical protein